MSDITPSKPFNRLFSEPAMLSELIDAIQKLKEAKAGATDADIEKINRLGRCLSIISSNAEEIDKNTQINVEFIGNSVRNISSALVDGSAEKIDNLYSTIYRFMLEYELSIGGEVELSRELRWFMDFATEQIDLFSEDAKAQIRFARDGMPISILKKLLTDPDIARLRDMRGYVDSIEAKIGAWDKHLGEKEVAANVLKENLEKYESAYNFVGLYDAFRNLGKEKSDQLFWLRIFTVLFGILAVVPIVVGAIFIHRSEFIATVENFITVAIPSFSLTVIFIYYFRIFLRNSDSCRSQILQLDLRKALCQFIQSYAHYAKTIKKDDASLLDRFESIIFSGIVATDEKLPSTFDGVDQIAGLVKAIRAN